MFNNMYNFISMEKTQSDNSTPLIAILLLLLQLFFMIFPSLVHIIEKFFPSFFKSYVQSDLVYANSNIRVKKGLDTELIHKAVSHVNKRDGDDHEDGRMRREDVEMVMGKFGIFCSRDSEELRESFGSDELSSLFDESEPSLEEVKEAFDVFDKNRDGFIDAKELQGVLCILGLKEGSELEDCKKMIRNFDINRDGKIDFNEFVKFMETTFC
ncbi:probable calcium-binding protein CML45 [Morus notabilis]|nr:probable calcium-binding protein CML45 [Morus notabilis]